MKSKICVAFFCMIFAGCGQDNFSLFDLDLNAFSYCGKFPVKVALYDSNAIVERLPLAWRLSEYSASGLAEMSFAPLPGDTLSVRILEFSSEISALAFYLNSGLVQEHFPVIEGDFRELAMRTGRRLFVFRYGILRTHSRGDLERFVQSFPGYRSGLPPEFLSLPFPDRALGETSIQVRNFLGIRSDFPMLVQGYRGNGLYWNAARSFGHVSENSWNAWVQAVRARDPEAFLSSDTLRFLAGNGERGMALRLQGGRSVAVWGALDSEALVKIFKKVARSVYDSQE